MRRCCAGRSSSRPKRPRSARPRRNLGHAVGQPMHRTAALVGQRLQDLLRRAHVGDFLRIERTGSRDPRSASRRSGDRGRAPPPSRSRATGRERPWRARSSASCRTAWVSITGLGLSAMVRRSMLIAPFVTAAERRSSSSSGSFISQCARRRSNSASGPPALEAARPQPALVGEQLRDAALADIVEHQERSVVRSRHHRLAGDAVGADHAEPAAPARRRRVRIGAGKIARHRMRPGRSA